MYQITEQELQEFIDKLHNIIIEKEDGFIVDNLSYQQLFKKLNSILHNKTLTHYFINGVIYSYINGDD